MLAFVIYGGSYCDTLLYYDNQVPSDCCQSNPQEHTKNIIIEYHLAHHHKTTQNLLLKESLG